MRNIPIIPKNSKIPQMGGQEAFPQVYQLAAIQVPVSTELTEEELRLWYYLAPFAVDRLRIHYDLEEVHTNFRDYLPGIDHLIEELVAANALGRLDDGCLAPTADAIVADLLVYCSPGEVNDTMEHGERVCYLTLRGTLWLLREFGSDPHPYRHMAHPGELLANYRAGLSNG